MAFASTIVQYDVIGEAIRKVIKKSKLDDNPNSPDSPDSPDNPDSPIQSSNSHKKIKKKSPAKDSPKRLNRHGEPTLNSSLSNSAIELTTNSSGGNTNSVGSESNGSNSNSPAKKTNGLSGGLGGNAGSKDGKKSIPAVTLIAVALYISIYIYGMIEY